MMLNAGQVQNLNEGGNFPQRRNPLRLVRRAGAESSGYYYSGVSSKQTLPCPRCFFRADLSDSGRLDPASLFHFYPPSLPAVAFMCEVAKEGKEHVKLVGTISMRAIEGD